MDYKLISHVRIECFDKRVKEYLAAGWELYGHPFSNGTSVCQAMTRKPQIVATNSIEQIVANTKVLKKVLKETGSPYARIGALM